MTDAAIIRTKVAETAKRLKKQGKDIYAGFYDAHEGCVILTFTKNADGTTNACYCFYSQMWNFNYNPDEI